jgi:hypothetical protein
MMPYRSILLIPVLLSIFSMNKTSAQSLAIPQNLNFNKLLPLGFLPNAIKISWDSVVNADDYLIDIATDSTFSPTVYGLQNFPQSLSLVYFDGEYREILLEQIRLGKTGIIFFSRCNARLFIRVRAVSNIGQQSLYSSTASIELRHHSCFTPLLPDATVGRLQRKNVYYYGGPFVSARSFRQDSLLYYFSPGAISELVSQGDSVQKLSSRSNESLLQLLEQNNIPLDTAWCHDGGSIQIFYPILEESPRPSPRNLFVKLRRPDARIKGYGFIDSLPSITNQRNPLIFWWRYSDSFTYYRYTLNTTSSVVSRTSFLTDIQFSPQPCQEVGYISYALHQASTVRIQLFNILGIPLFSVFEGWQSAGEHRIPLDTQQLPSGAYILHIHSNSPTGTIGFKPLPISIIH